MVVPVKNPLKDWSFKTCWPLNPDKCGRDSCNTSSLQIYESATYAAQLDLGSPLLSQSDRAGRDLGGRMLEL